MKNDLTAAPIPAPIVTTPEAAPAEGSAAAIAAELVAVMAANERKHPAPRQRKATAKPTPAPKQTAPTLAFHLCTRGAACRRPSLSPRKATIMKISTAGNSKLLRQEDVHSPFVAIIQDVRVEKFKDKRGVEDDVYVVYFATGKPMKFNVINRKTVVAAYGDQRDAWIGKPVEIYVDPNVWMGSERTGGIRVRIPAAATATASHAGACNGNDTAPKAAPPPGVFPTLDERHAQLIRAINQTDSDANLNQWLRWGEQFPFSDQQRSEQAARRLAAHERIALASAPAAPRRPVPART